MQNQRPAPRRRLPVFLLAGALAMGAAAAVAPPTPLFSSVPPEWRGTVEVRAPWTDPAGQPQALELLRRADGERFYVCHVVTGVCGDSGREESCRIHRCAACFDELGGFLGYRVAANEPFTKARHAPFSQADYAALDRILRDTTHVLGSLADSEAGLDGVTHATTAYIAEQSVPGAFYTSLALWRLMQRTIPARLRAWTLARCGAAEIRQWTTRGQGLKVWWFFDHAGESAIPAAQRADLAYETLAVLALPEAQAAALRYLDRVQAPFRPAAAQGAVYARLADTVKPEFLQWWSRHGYSDPALATALRAELDRHAAAADPVSVYALSYLARTGLAREADWRATLEKLAAVSPSAYLRGKAAELLRQPEQQP